MTINATIYKNFLEAFMALSGMGSLLHGQVISFLQKGQAFI